MAWRHIVILWLLKIAVVRITGRKNWPIAFRVRTVPIYYGCTNLEEYFPAASFIRIDINKPEAALEIITTMLASDSWEARLPALVEARNLILERYQFFPQMQKLVERHYKILPKKNLVLQPYLERHSFVQKVRVRLSGLIRG